MYLFVGKYFPYLSVFLIISPLGATLIVGPGSFMPSTTRSRSRSRSRSQRQAPKPSPQQSAKIPRQPRSRRSPPGSSSDSKNSSSSRTHTRTPSRTRNRTPSRTQTRSSTRKAAAASTLRNQHSAVSSSSKETTAEVMELPRRTNALFALIRKFSGGPFISRQGARSLILWYIARALFTVYFFSVLCSLFNQKRHKKQFIEKNSTVTPLLVQVLPEWS